MLENQEPRRCGVDGCFFSSELDLAEFDQLNSGAFPCSTWLLLTVVGEGAAGVWFGIGESRPELDSDLGRVVGLLANLSREVSQAPLAGRLQSSASQCSSCKRRAGFAQAPPGVGLRTFGIPMGHPAHVKAVKVLHLDSVPIHKTVGLCKRVPVRLVEDVAK